MDIGKRLTALREARGLSMRKLADRSGVSQPFISGIEAGDKQPTVDSLYKLCNGLGISLIEFLGGDSATESLPPNLRELVATARELTPTQLRALNQFIKTMTGKGSDIDDAFDIDAHNEEARRTFRQALADEPELLNFWLEQEDRENLQLFMSQAKTLEPEDIKDIVRKLKQVEDEEAAEY